MFNYVTWLKNHDYIFQRCDVSLEIRLNTKQPLNDSSANASKNDTTCVSTYLVSL